MAVTTPTAFMMGMADDPPPVTPVDEGGEENTEPEGTEPTQTQPLTGDQAPSLADQLAAEFERRGRGSAPTSDSGEGDGGDEPIAAGGDEPAITEETTDEGGEVEGGDGGTSSSPGTTIPSSIPAPEFSMDSYAEQLYGRKLTPQEAQNLFAWQQQFAALDDTQLNAIQGIVSGQPPVTTTPTPEPEPDPNVDPYIQQHLDQALDPLKEQLGQVTQFVQTEAQRRAAENTARTQSQIEAGTQAFAEEFSLSDEQMQDLESRVVQSGIFPGMYNAMQQDARAAMQAALQQMFWATPTYRDIAIQRQLDEAQNLEEQDKTRKRKASAISGGGGQVSREAPPPTTQQQRQAAMVGELTEYMNGSGFQT